MLGSRDDVHDGQEALHLARGDFDVQSRQRALDDHVLIFCALIYRDVQIDVKFLDQCGHVLGGIYYCDLKGSASVPLGGRCTPAEP